MKSLLRAALAAGSFLLAVNAHATVFSFSYTFDATTKLTGTLQGDAAGDYVNNISDVHVFLNGTEFSNLVFFGGYDSATHAFGAAGSAVVSTKADLNQFVFADGNPDPSSPDFVSNYFAFINDATFGQDVVAVNYNLDPIAAAEDSTGQGNWSLVAQAEVPEPSSVALMLGALGMLGIARRRRS